ncbi:Lysine-specific demethylase 3B, putative isoform 2 [Hibiscus syriacus]|uniref:Lysine-specific demethylase 3B, putative isoform 2 n=1 Tax=Hibiscus syriacus TaxID=106335 RepID=A0A6A3CTA6_HIBSY|nr:Lysine-specific demethylase 3B, putative isoform 2 [Hibiscus syriacus]
MFLMGSIENSLAKAENEELRKDTAHLDWFEVEIGIVQSFLGSLGKLAQSSMCDEKLKLKGCLSSQTFQEQFPDHYTELVRSLPLPDYLDPASGVLNIAARLPQEFMKPDLGPSVSISYCSDEELVQANSVTKLCYSLCDMVNVVAHATDAPVSMKQLNKIRKLLEKKQFQDQKELAKTNLDQKMATKVKEKCPSNDKNMEEVGLNGTVSKEICRLLPSNTIHSSEALEDHEILRTRTDLAKLCGATWDVFRRQDVPKLIEYLKKYANEFDHTCGFQKHVVHPILDQNFFLVAGHKRRLKEEYAGCPYQIRNVKSVRIGEEEEERRENIEEHLGNEGRGLGIEETNWEFNQVKGKGLLTEQAEQEDGLKEKPKTEGPVPVKEKKEKNQLAALVKKGQDETNPPKWWETQENRITALESRMATNQGYVKELLKILTGRNEEQEHSTDEQVQSPDTSKNKDRNPVLVTVVNDKSRFTYKPDEPGLLKTKPDACLALKNSFRPENQVGENIDSRPNLFGLETEKRGPEVHLTVLELCGTDLR